jgi:hypothetical protein
VALVTDDPGEVPLAVSLYLDAAVDRAKDAGVAAPGIGVGHESPENRRVKFSQSTVLLSSVSGKRPATSSLGINSQQVVVAIALVAYNDRKKRSKRTIYSIYYIDLLQG